MVGHKAARGEEQDVGKMAPHARGRCVDDTHDDSSRPAIFARGQGSKQVGHKLSHDRVKPRGGFIEKDDLRVGEELSADR